MPVYVNTGIGGQLVMIPETVYGTVPAGLTTGSAQPYEFNNESLKGKNRCQIAVGGGVTYVNLYAGTYRGTTDGFAGYNYPYIVITRMRGSAPGHDVNLAKTKDYLISVQAPQGASHLGDWGSGNLGDEHKAIHMGSGRLTFASDGRSGSINTELTPLAHTMTHGKVHLKASWSCSKSSVEG